MPPAVARKGGVEGMPCDGLERVVCTGTGDMPVDTVVFPVACDSPSG